MRLKIIFFSAVYLVFTVSLCSCESFRRKFVRKSRKEKEIKVVVDIQEYQSQYSAEELYQRYYSFWLAAHNELAELLEGNETNHKRVMGYAGRIAENLAQMKTLLSAEKQEPLNSCIAAQQEIISQLDSGDLSRGRQLQIKSMLNKQRKKVQGEFAYPRVREYIVE